MEQLVGRITICIDNNKSLEERLADIKGKVIKKDPKEYIYLVRFGNTGYYEIGSTSNPEKKIETLSDVLPKKPKMIYATEIMNAEFHACRIRDWYSHKHANGKWFKLSKLDIGWIKGYPYCWVCPKCMGVNTHNKLVLNSCCFAFIPTPEG